jgi:hypothetical protein
MLLIENLVTDHRSALGGISSLYEVCESILRQIRGIYKNFRLFHKHKKF